jgi:hypothetical protein
MSTEITERWTGKAWNLTEQGLDAVREFDVSGAATEKDALQALIDSGKADFNAEHPYQPALKCRSITLGEALGPSFFRFRAAYGQPPMGLYVLKNTVDALTAPVRVTWRRAVKSVAIDRDLDDIPIVNSAGDPFPIQQIEVTSRLLTLKRFEPFFDIAKAEAFENTVNSNVINLGPIRIGQGQGRIVSIEPTSEYPVDAPYLEMAYDFEIDTSDDDPFQLYLIDQGHRGWRSNSGGARTGNLVDADGNAVSDDVLLDGTGKPAWGVALVGETKKAVPITNPSLPDYYAKVTVFPSTKLGFRIRDFTDWGGLGI